MKRKDVSCDNLIKLSFLVLNTEFKCFRCWNIWKLNKLKAVFCRYKSNLWMTSRRLLILPKLIVAQTVQKLRAFRRFVSRRRWSTPCDRWIKSTLLYPVSLTYSSIGLLLYNRSVSLPVGLSYSGFPTKILYAFIVWFNLYIVYLLMGMETILKASLHFLSLYF